MAEVDALFEHALEHTLGDMGAHAVVDAARSGEFLGRGLVGAAVAGLEFGEAGLVDVEADQRALFAEFDREGEADVAQADDGDGRG